ncbi:MAG TPA: hypothetical protein VF456_12770 [Vicinamibacterales bacterium]
MQTRQTARRFHLAQGPLQNGRYRQERGITPMYLDYTALVSLTILVLFVLTALVRQQQVVNTYKRAQREVLDRQKEVLELERESVRLLGVIAKSLERS